jgi:hypothetical protein
MKQGRVFCCSALMLLVAFSSRTPFYAFAHIEKRVRNGAGTQGWLALGNGGFNCFVLMIRILHFHFRDKWERNSLLSLLYDLSRISSALCLFSLLWMERSVSTPMDSPHLLTSSRLSPFSTEISNCHQNVHHRYGALPLVLCEPPIEHSILFPFAHW